eukprot:1846795-Prymnesium_polylepis.1
MVRSRERPVWVAPHAGLVPRRFCAASGSSLAFSTLECAGCGRLHLVLRCVTRLRGVVAHYALRWWSTGSAREVGSTLPCMCVENMCGLHWRFARWDSRQRTRGWVQRLRGCAVTPFFARIEARVERTCVACPARTSTHQKRTRTPKH